MALSPGTHLGAYEIVALIGVGGMGEVYRARDTRLDRTVAIKVLAASLAAESQLRERFAREARAISSLNHPHICALYDVGDAPNPEPSLAGGDTVRFLVLEHLEGQTLAERLTRGPLPPADALRHAIDICDALDTAHRAGIVHRDLKPANVMLVKAGAKLLDFGLAKSTGPVVVTNGLSTQSTRGQHLTTAGTILGTFQYMAPEQIEGRAADARTDIFSFGALLFEMVTGRRAFEGSTQASILGAILKDDPPAASHIQPVAPAALDRILGTCLAKDPDDRYQSARDLLRDLTWVASGSSEDVEARTTAAPVRSHRVAWLIAALSIAALIAMTVIAMRRNGDGVPAADAVQFAIEPPENTSFGGPAAGGTGTATQVAVSPDGRTIVFVAGAKAQYQIWLRPIGSMAARPIPGTDGGTFPFWSPDNRFIGFFAAGKLKKVQIAGGPPIVLCDAPSGRGGSWNRDDVILFMPAPFGSGLLRVSSAGGVPTVVTTFDPAIGDSHRWPHFLPDGRHFLYTAVTGNCCPPAKPGVIKIGSLDPADATIELFQGDSSVSYSSGHLIFGRSETLMAQPFDPDTRQVTGDAFPLADQVYPEGSRYVSASLSTKGTLVYGRSGPLPPQQLTWFDRTGRVLATLGEAVPNTDLALSPDERRIAVTLGTGTPENLDIWVIDIERMVRSRLTFDPGADRSPVWSPDGTRIAFAGQRSGKISLRQKLINGTAADEPLLDGSGSIAPSLIPSAWSADGRFVAYTVRRALPDSSDVWILPLFGDRKPFPLAQTEFLETAAVFSPDGRWIAYWAAEGGQPDVYVQPFPGGGGRYQVSRNGGNHPVWRADGKELFYLEPDGTMMAVPIDTTHQFDAGVPEALFRTGPLRQAYAVSKDGKRFLVNARPPVSGAAPLTVIVNWAAAIQN